MDSDKLKNVADAIERHILGKLRDTGRSEIVVRRSELAGRIVCAPSQVSYVLNTRFTYDKGFKVESRRGVNGFVRIVRIADADEVASIDIDNIENLERDDLRALTLSWRRQGEISERERRFIDTALDIIYEKLSVAERAVAVKRLLAELI